MQLLLTLASSISLLFDLVVTTFPRGMRSRKKDTERRLDLPHYLHSHQQNKFLTPPIKRLFKVNNKSCKGGVKNDKITKRHQEEYDDLF